MAIEKVLHILTYRGRSDLARALRGSRYELDESSTYGSRWHSTLTTVDIYAPIQKHEGLQKLTDGDRAAIVEAFRVLYPLKDAEPEIVSVEFLIDPDAPVPFSTREASKLPTIDFVYISEQVQRCDDRIASADFEGAITNARSLVESLCKYILEEEGAATNPKDDLPVLYKKTAELLNMHPSQHVAKSLKQILSGCFSVVQGLAAVRNDLGDAHGKSASTRYKPEERHAMLSVAIAKALGDFMYASYTESLRGGS